MTRKPANVYEQVWSGEEFDATGVFDLACCGCGFVHEVRARSAKGRVKLTLRELPKATAALRKHEGIRVTRTK